MLKKLIKQDTNPSPQDLIFQQLKKNKMQYIKNIVAIGQKTKVAY